MLRPTLIALSLVLAGVAAAPAAIAEKSQIYHGWLDDLAVGGYDPVAYFTVGRPVPGQRAFEMRYKDATWRFSSAANLALFRANPGRYAPQYGGYCAWAASQGYTAKGDPNAWKIVNGRLYLNYDANIQRRWEADIPGFIRRGDANWPGILSR